MLGIDIVDNNGEMAVSVAERIGLLAIVIDGQFDLEGRGGMTQIDEREIRKFKMIGNFEPEGARVEVQRLRFVEHADHRMNGFCHSVQFLWPLVCADLRSQPTSGGSSGLFHGRTKAAMLRAGFRKRGEIDGAKKW